MAGASPDGARAGVHRQLARLAPVSGWRATMPSPPSAFAFGPRPNIRSLRVAIRLGDSERPAKVEGGRSSLGAPPALKFTTRHQKIPPRAKYFEGFAVVFLRPSNKYVSILK